MATDFVADLTDGRKIGNGFCSGFNGFNGGSSATDFLADLTDRRKIGNGFCSGFNGFNGGSATDFLTDLADLMDVSL